MILGRVELVVNRDGVRVDDQIELQDRELYGRTGMETSSEMSTSNAKITGSGADRSLLVSMADRMCRKHTVSRRLSS